jgi:ATP-dependent Lon protease
MAEKVNSCLPLIALRGRVVFPETTAVFDAGRMVTLKAIRAAADAGMMLFVCAQKDGEKENIEPDDIYTVGTIVKMEKVTPLPGNRVRVQGKGLTRARAKEISLGEDYFTAVVEEAVTIHTDDALEEAYFRTTKSKLMEFSSTDVRADARFSKDALAIVEKCEDAEKFSYLAANSLQISCSTKQEILEKDKLVERLSYLDKCLNDEMEISRLERKINAMVRESIDKNQKEYYLREQLKAIHAELGDDEDEKAKLEEAIKEKHMPQEVEEKALKELSRMSRMQSSSPDYNVIRGYLDWLLDLEWNKCTKDTEKLSDAVAILNADHYGLEKIKQRITEYLAVLKLTDGLNAPILCFVGPPGVGKTSIATSIARALDRKFVRMSLGGVKDEAEIRGHRKTYIGAMPGRIITAIKNAGSVNPVFLLDEIDKLSSDMRGDPASALLEVLDPAQNCTFRDRYLEVPFDLSKVLFIATANSLDTVPPALLDRMEIIELTGYTQEEKREIAKRYLVPKKRTANGLMDDDIIFEDSALDAIISGYTMEAGVRNLERQIDAVCRKVAVSKAEGNDKKFVATAENIHEFLGAKRYDRDAEAPKTDEIGAATGLAWTAVGGTTLTIEVSTMHGKGDILLTGKLGDVMKESARAAISYIRSNADTYGIDSNIFESTDIHIHVPEGATPKDGPSAGITMATAILSAFTKKPVRHTVAMTGEITLRGKVLPIGGLKEKSLAAYRIGIHDIIIPHDNQKDLEEIPDSVRGSLNFIPVTEVSEVFKQAIVGI